MEKSAFSTTEHFLRLLTDVKPGEAPTAVMMFSNLFLVVYWLVAGVLLVREHRRATEAHS